MIRAFSDFTTNFDWVVEQDDIRVARYIGYDQNSAYRAARKANELRHDNLTSVDKSV